MTIDITQHLRRLVLAGLPLVGVGCEPAPTQVGELAARVCEPRLVLDRGPSGATLTATVAFDKNDPQIADLYRACVDTNQLCGRLCSELLFASVPGVGRDPLQCTLGCDGEGGALATITYSKSQTVAGRRPEGFAGAASTRPGTSPAAFFAACAELEGASIGAFAILAAELERHGAPAALIWRARGAIRDEGRHFKLTNRLAGRFGGAPARCPRVQIPPARDLATIARENATEGCVSETFSAAIALWQAATARDQAVRAVMAEIAEDELAHAQLAWDVHAWISRKVGPEVGAELERARAEAAHRLLHACAEPVDEDLVDRAGVPSRAAAAWLVARASELWREGAGRARA